MDQVEEIKSKVDIVQVVGEYVKLTRAGRNFKGLCPFHGEKSPSFMVNPELAIFKCFGCGVGGDVYEFLGKIEGMEFGETLKTLAKRVGITLITQAPTKGEEERENLLRMNSLAVEYYHYLLVSHDLGKEALEYLKKRKISKEAVETYKLGFAPDGWDFLIKYLVGKKGFKAQDLERAGLLIPGTRGDGYDRFRNRVMFPLNNNRGLTVGFAGRVLPGSNVEQAKYINTPETDIYHKGDLLYALDINKAEIKSKGWVVVVEGEIDAIASWQAGIRNVVAIKGSALTGRQVEVIKRYAETLVLALDADIAGDMAARRGIQIAEKAGMILKVTSPKSQISNYKYKDPGDCATEDPQMWRDIVDKAVPIYDFYITSAIERYGLTAIGKTKIGKELVPIWAQIDDEITKGHYIKRLAEVLGVEEGDVRGQLGKILNSKVEDPNKVINYKANEQKKTRREVMEEYVVGLAVRNDKIKQLLNPHVQKLFGDGFWEKIIEQFVTYDKQYKNIGELIEKLPAELKEKVEELMLVEDEKEVKDMEVEWARAIKDLEEAGIREKLIEVRATGDQDDKPKEFLKLTHRLNELTRGR